MQYRLACLLIVIATLAIIVHTDLLEVSRTASPVLVLGFLLLSAYLTGRLLEKVRLPLITAYIFVGLFFGPYFFKFYSSDIIADLDFINSLALAFIAFCAGGELRLSRIRTMLKSIVFLIGGVTAVVFLGVTLTVLAMSGFIPFIREYNFSAQLAIAAIFGVIAVARSPSSTIAVISETKSKGNYTDTILSVTIVTDFVIIIFFAVVISACQILIASKETIEPVFILNILFEIAIAFVSGYFLGKWIVFLIEKVKVEFPIVIVTMGFIVVKFCHFLGTYLQEVQEISINLEPLLVCMAAGFTVQNFSDHGPSFLNKMDRVSLLIYIIFFAITGATINVEVLKTSWYLGLAITLSRAVMIFIGSYFSGKFSGDQPRIYKNTWLGFITQAGVSLGLLTEVVRRFPEIGVPVQSILVASITFNQIIGPVAFKYALIKTGEAAVKNKR